VPNVVDEVSGITGFERPAIEHVYLSPAPPIPGASLCTSVETSNGHLIEEWFLLGEGSVFRTLVHDERGWVPMTMSKPVTSGNVWRNDPQLDRITLDAETRKPVDDSKQTD
jgi:hypothetical protein